MFPFFGSSLAKRNAKKIATDWFPKILYKIVWRAMGSPKLSFLSNLDPIKDEELLFYAVYNELVGVDNESFGEGLFREEFKKNYQKNKNKISELIQEIIKQNPDIVRMVMQTTAIRDVFKLPYFRTKTLETLSITQQDNPHLNPNTLKLCNDYCLFMEEVAFKYKHINGKLTM